MQWKLCLYVALLSTLLTYLQPSHPSGGLRPATNCLQPTLFWANILISSQVLSMFIRSATNCLCHVSFGLPRPLVPTKTQSSACFGISRFCFLKVCPIHLNLLCLICIFICFCLVLVQRSTLLILWGQYILRIFLRHLLTKTWIFCSRFLVKLQLSEP